MVKCFIVSITSVWEMAKVPPGNMFAPHLTGLAKRTMRKRGEESGM
jgi:hypothetical protein